MQELAYDTKTLALKRANHIIEHDGLRASVWPVKVAVDPEQLPFTWTPAPKMPPSAVFTPQDPAVKLQVAYDAPRRVFSQVPSLSSYVEASLASAQTALGNQTASPNTAFAVPDTFEVDSAGQLVLFPRDLPEPAR